MLDRFRRWWLTVTIISLTSAIQPKLARAAGVLDSFGSDLPTVVAGLYNWSIGAGVTIAIIVLMYAGYLMITSAGDPQKVGFAKEIIVGSLSGLALLAAARLILNILSVAK